MARWMKLAVGIFISAVCLWLAFRSVSIGQVWTAAAAISSQTILVCFVLGSCTLFMRSVRWRILLKASEPLPLATAFAVNSAGQMGNMILPARLGDLFRATNLGRAGLSTGFALATVLAERVLDGGFLVLVFASALTTFSNLPGWLTRSGFLLAIAALAGLAVTVLLPHFENAILELIGRVAPQRVQPRLRRLAAQFLSGLRSFHHAGRASGFLFWTVVIWVLDGTGIMVLSHGMGITLSPPQAALVLTSIALASVVPAAPGNLGVLQYVAVSVLVPLGAAPAQALSLALILQVLNTTTLGLWGAGSLWFLSARTPRTAAAPASEPVRALS
jgi:glycosyltransferase 2 family protein